MMQYGSSGAGRELADRPSEEATASPAEGNLPADAVAVKACSVMTTVSCGTGQWGVRRRQDGDSKAHHAVPGMDREWRLHQ